MVTQDHASRAGAPLLLRAAEIVERDLEKLAEMETRDMGKPIGESREDIQEVASGGPET